MKYDYKQVKELMTKKRHTAKHWTKKDILLIQEAQQTGNWNEVYNSKLYVEYGGEYCTMLAVLNQLD